MLTATVVSQDSSYVYQKPVKVQSVPLRLQEPKEPIDVLLREVESANGALPTLRATMGLDREPGARLKKQKLSRMKKPCVTYKVWQEKDWETVGKTVVVKFSPWKGEEKGDSWSDVGQEYEIQRIVKRDSNIPVAKVLHLSTDEEMAVVGTKFMVMTFVEGDNYQTVSEIPREKLKLVIFRAVEALANVHRYYWVWRYGGGWEVKMDQKTSEGYWEKMVHIWFSNFKAAIVGDASGTHHRSVKLYKEMKDGRKPSQTDTCLVHGDFSISNLIFNDQCKVVAILDWKVDENADPLADVAYFMMVFLQPGDYGYRYKQLPKVLVGPPDRFIPSESTALDWYRGASIHVHSFTDEDYGFAKAVSCLRLISVFKAAADDDFEGHESAACPVITSEPQKVVKILTAAGWNFFESWKV